MDFFNVVKDPYQVFNQSKNNSNLQSKGEGKKFTKKNKMNVNERDNMMQSNTGLYNGNLNQITSNPFQTNSNMDFGNHSTNTWMNNKPQAASQNYNSYHQSNKQFFPINPSHDSGGIKQQQAFHSSQQANFNESTTNQSPFHQANTTTMFNPAAINSNPFIHTANNSFHAKTPPSQPPNSAMMSEQQSYPPTTFHNQPSVKKKPLPSHHQGMTSPIVLSCRVCQATFSTHEELKRHLKTEKHYEPTVAVTAAANESYPPPANKAMTNPNNPIIDRMNATNTASNVHPIAGDHPHFKSPPVAAAVQKKMGGPSQAVKKKPYGMGGASVHNAVHASVHNAVHDLPQPSKNMFMQPSPGSKEGGLFGRLTTAAAFKGKAAEPPPKAMMIYDEDDDDEDDPISSSYPVTSMSSARPNHAQSLIPKNDSVIVEEEEDFEGDEEVDEGGDEEGDEQNEKREDEEEDDVAEEGVADIFHTTPRDDMEDRLIAPLLSQPVVVVHHPPPPTGQGMSLCTDMCPHEERLSRVRDNDVHKIELLLASAAQTQSPLSDVEALKYGMIKKFQRSSADHELQIPHLIRTPGTLLETLTFIEDKVMSMADQGSRPSVVSELIVYLFIWDRFRMIAKDFILQQVASQTIGPIWVQCHERMVRWFILMDHHMRANEDFASGHAQQNAERLNDFLKTLHGYYFRTGKQSNLAMPNICEFVGYFLIIQLGNRGEVSKFLQQLPREVLMSSEIQFSLQIWGALKTENFARFFRLLGDASLLQACLMFRYVGEVRLMAIKKILKTHHQKGLPLTCYPVMDLRQLLMFDDLSEAVGFLVHCGIRVVVMEGEALVAEVTEWDKDNILINEERGQQICALLHRDMDVANNMPTDKNGHPIPPLPHCMIHWIKDLKSIKRTTHAAISRYTIAEICRGVASKSRDVSPATSVRPATGKVDTSVESSVEERMKSLKDRLIQKQLRVAVPASVAVQDTASGLPPRLTSQRSSFDLTAPLESGRNRTSPRSLPRSEPVFGLPLPPGGVSGSDGKQNHIDGVVDHDTKGTALPLSLMNHSIDILPRPSSLSFTHPVPSTVPSITTATTAGTITATATATATTAPSIMAMRYDDPDPRTTTLSPFPHLNHNSFPTWTLPSDQTHPHSFTTSHATTVSKNAMVTQNSSHATSLQSSPTATVTKEKPFQWSMLPSAAHSAIPALGPVAPVPVGSSSSLSWIPSTTSLPPFPKPSSSSMGVTAPSGSRPDRSPHRVLDSAPQSVKDSSSSASSSWLSHPFTFQFPPPDTMHQVAVPTPAPTAAPIDTSQYMKTWVGVLTNDSDPLLTAPSLDPLTHPHPSSAVETAARTIRQFRKKLASQQKKRLLVTTLSHWKRYLEESRRWQARMGLMVGWWRWKKAWVRRTGHRNRLIADIQNISLTNPSTPSTSMTLLTPGRASSKAMIASKKRSRSSFLLPSLSWTGLLCDGIKTFLPSHRTTAVIPLEEVGNILWSRQLEHIQKLSPLSASSDWRGDLFLRIELLSCATCPGVWIDPGSNPSNLMIQLCRSVLSDETTMMSHYFPPTPPTPHSTTERDSRKQWLLHQLLRPSRNEDPDVLKRSSYPIGEFSQSLGRHKDVMKDKGRDASRLRVSVHDVIIPLHPHPPSPIDEETQAVLLFLTNQDIVTLSQHPPTTPHPLVQTLPPHRPIVLLLSVTSTVPTITAGWSQFRVHRTTERSDEVQILWQPPHLDHHLNHYLDHHYLDQQTMIEADVVEMIRQTLSVLHNQVDGVMDFLKQVLVIVTGTECPTTRPSSMSKTDREEWLTICQQVMQHALQAMAREVGPMPCITKTPLLVWLEQGLSSQLLSSTISDPIRSLTSWERPRPMHRDIMPQFLHQDLPRILALSLLQTTSRTLQTYNHTLDRHIDLIQHSIDAYQKMVPKFPAKDFCDNSDGTCPRGVYSPTTSSSIDDSLPWQWIIQPGPDNPHIKLLGQMKITSDWIKLLDQLDQELKLDQTALNTVLYHIAVLMSTDETVQMSADKAKEWDEGRGWEGVFRMIREKINAWMEGMIQLLERVEVGRALDRSIGSLMDRMVDDGQGMLIQLVMDLIQPYYRNKMEKLVDQMDQFLDLPKDIYLIHPVEQGEANGLGRKGAEWRGEEGGRGDGRGWSKRNETMRSLRDVIDEIVQESCTQREAIHDDDPPVTAEEEGERREDDSIMEEEEEMEEMGDWICDELQSELNFQRYIQKQLIIHHPPSVLEEDEDGEEEGLDGQYRRNDEELDWMGPAARGGEEEEDGEGVIESVEELLQRCQEESRRYEELMHRSVVQ